MLEAFKKHIAAKELFSPRSKILATVSGGVDSVVLASLLHQAGYSFAIAHVNFGLRGDESDGDEQLVAALADRLGVPFYRASLPIVAEKGQSVQMQARTLRYQWFNELAEQEGFTHIATAHHRNDQVETVLHHLVRGTGHKGLTGMDDRSGQLVRPLLPFSKAEIMAYAQAQSLSWREDSSNQKNVYRRNQLRNDVIPLLESINPSFVDTFSHSIRRFQEEHKVIQSALPDWSDRRELTVAEVLQQPSPVLAVFHWLEPLGFTYSDACDLADALEGIPGKQFLSSAHRVVKDRDRLYVQPTSIDKQAEGFIPALGSIDVGDCTFHVTSVSRSDVQFGVDALEIFVDADRVQFPLMVRSWQQGDRFYPLGMKGQKKVSDVWVDEKVPLHLKNEQLLLLSEHKIVWVVGYRLDDRFKITDATTSILKIQCTKNA